MADPSHGPPHGGPPGGQPLPPDFFDPVPFANHRATILGICISLMTFCWLAITARLSTRLFITKNPGWDDFFIVSAALMVSLGTVAFCVSTNYGMGHHIYLLQPPDISNVLLCNYLFGASYNCSTALIKMSLLFQYLRVYERGTWPYRLTQLLLIVISLWGFAFGFIAWFSCLPHPSALWEMTGKGCYGGASANMAEVVKVITAHAGLNFAFDALVLMLAFGLLFAKELPTTQMGMMVLLFVGLISCMFAGWRLADIIIVSAGRSSDLSWDLPGPTLLSLCEIYIASLCASIPFFWPMIKESINKILVTYEFGVSTESRFHDHDDDAVELAPSQPGGWGQSPGTEDLRSLGSKSSDRYAEREIRTTPYVDDFSRPPGDPFAEEFRTETAVQSGMTGKKKGGFVRFKNPAKSPV